MNMNFEMKDLEDIKGNLTFAWPSFDPQVDDETFWKNEFEKYGTCAVCQEVDIEDTIDYFDAILDTQWDYFGRYFSDRGIVQDYTKPVPLEALTNALKDGLFEDMSELYCEGQRDGFDILQEFRVCTDLSFLPVPCPPMGKPTCTTEKVWYLGNSGMSHVPSIVLMTFSLLLAYIISKA